MLRFLLQAMTFIPKALPIRATRLPMRPSPKTPSTRPSSSPPTDVCQPPVRTAVFSTTRWREAARISAHVNSTVEAMVPPVVPT